jgi:dihydroanticapsin dehydrogenase
MCRTTPFLATCQKSAESIEVARLKGRVAVVTGGAEGIGKGIAQALVGDAARVAILDRNIEKGTQASDELSQTAGAHCPFAACDVSREEQVTDAIQNVVELLGPPTILVNNAAVFVMRGVDASLEDWHEVTSVNIIGAALLTKHIVPHMKHAGGGAIINIGSVSALIAQREFLTYSATKAAVVAMTRCLALDLSAANIRVNAVSPGAVWSATVEREAADRGLSREAAALEPNLGREQIMQRLGDPIEIGRAVAFLASDDASFITGANLLVDGGWTAL